MKFSDDQTDESLGRSLRALLGDLEATPDAAADKRIKALLNARAARKKPYGLIAAALLLLTGAGVTLWPREFPGGSSRPDTPVGVAGNIANGAASSGPTIQTPSVRHSPVHPKPASLPIKNLTEVTETAPGVPARPPVSKTTTRPPRPGRRHTLRNDALTSLRSNFSLTQDTASQYSGPPDTAVDAVQPERFLHIVTNLRQLERAHTLSWPEITLIRPANAPGQPCNEPLDTNRPTARRNGFRWVFTLAPANTFQNVTILPQAESYIQNVSFPSSGVSPGFKIGGGLIFHGFQLQLNYSRLDLRSHFEYASDSYEVSGNFPDKVIVKRTGTTETTNLVRNTLGIILRKRWGWYDRTLGNVFVTPGAEYAYPLGPPHQKSYLGQLSAGRSLQLGERIFLDLGPYLEYSFTQHPVKDHHLKLRPYRIGIMGTIGLK